MLADRWGGDWPSGTPRLGPGPSGCGVTPFLYGARNDTESRHTNIKERAKYLPIDVPGQELRLLGAAMTMNAVAWQLHLQAHGEPNVLDDTA